MQIAIVLYDRFTALDAVGPYEVLSRLPGTTTTFVASKTGLIRSDTGFLALAADRSLADLTRPDLIVVPGGPGQTAVMTDRPLLSWLRNAHPTATWTTSVCTGSLILAAAGLLAGRRATSHWLALDELNALGARATKGRIVADGTIMTAAGVTAGIDLALDLAARIAGTQVAQAIQLGLEYDPQPPFDAGSPTTAPPAIVDLLRASRDTILGHSGARNRGDLGRPLSGGVRP